MVTGMVATQVGIGIERIVSTVYIRTYEGFTIVLGLLLAGFAFLLSLGVSFNVLNDVNPGEIRLTCMGVPSTAGDKSRLLYYVIIACDLITMGLFLICLRLNGKCNIGDSQFVLGVKYQRKENANVIRMLLPNVVAHCFVYCSFSIAASFLRANKNLFTDLSYNVLAVAINLVPHYTVVELIVLHSILTKVGSKAQKFTTRILEHQQASEKDIYFAGYQQHWN